jgi:F-type H+-transporting ATPase subunit gamma
MALSKKLIKQKIQTAKGIKKTTKTMEMISAVKMRRLTARTNNVRLFARYAYELIQSIASYEELASPLITKRDNGRTLLVIVGSQKGLCGGYNVNINRKLRDLITDGHLDHEQTDVIAIGRYATRIANRLQLPLKAEFPGMSEIASPKEVEEVFELCTSLFLRDNTYRKVALIHTSFFKALEYTPVFRRLLPLSVKMVEELAHTRPVSDDAMQMKANLYDFEPSIEVVVKHALPQLLLAVFYEAILESLACEHGSRMVAMKNATDNATTMQADLTLRFNKARQQSVTQEISEISSGAEALAGATLTI